MKNKKTIQKIFIGLVIAVVLLVAYAVLNGNSVDRNNSTLSSSIKSGSLGQIQETDTALANAEILRILGAIKDINLEDDIFTNPVFKELVDSRFSIPRPLRIGRPNPFFPIGFDSIAESNQASVEESSNNLNNIPEGLQEEAGAPSEPSNFFEDLGF